MASQPRSIFLDRDGTINFDAGYTHKISDWRFMPGAIAGLAALQAAGFSLVVVSNQSGIGRGFYTEADLKRLEAYVSAELATHGVEIALWAHCPHSPEALCDCRKPAPGMILSAARELNIDLASSWTLGDKLSDVQAGLAAGCRAGLIGSPDPKTLASLPKGVFVWPNLSAAAQAIIEL